jgi:hypothetical protein
MTKQIHLITLHGGCFVGGSASWDVEQTKALQECGYIIHQLDFPTNNLSETLRYIRNEIIKLNIPKPHIVLGRSSGGYLAKCLFDEGIFDIAIYLAPVFSPILRGTMIPMLGEKQQSFFINEIIPHTTSWNSEKEILFLAFDDKNVPDELFTSEQLKLSIRPGPNSHNSLLSCTSKQLLNYINMFIHKNIEFNTI